MNDSLSTPDLFSFISYRREANGGFLYNPYMQRELPLDDFEVAVVELCDGEHPAVFLPAELARRFRTDLATAESRVDEALLKLGRYYALKWTGIPIASLPASAPAVTGADVGTTQCADCGSHGPGYLSAPLSILWEVTHACNLNCLHCLSASGRPLPGEMSTGDALALVEEMARLGVFSATIGGGEPLLRRDLFEILARMTELNLAARLSTNGMLVDETTLRQLEGLNVFSVQISVDGLEASHDRFRRRPGAFARAIQALRLFKQAGYYVFMTVTATAMTVDEVPALLDLALELGVSTFKAGPHVPLGRALDHHDELALTPQQIQDTARLLRARSKELDGEIDFQIDGFFPWLLDPEPERQAGACKLGPGCSAATAQVTVACDGEVYACPYMRDESAGNLRHVTLAEAWRSDGLFEALRRFDPNRIEGRCQTCGYLGADCHGGCRGTALATMGDLYARDPHCWLD